MSHFHSLQYTQPYKQAKQLINLILLLGNCSMNNCQNWNFHGNRVKQIRLTASCVKHIHGLMLDQQVAEGDDKAILYAIYKNSIRRH